jgi:NAD(P)H dehydrogenase (quinone)
MKIAVTGASGQLGRLAITQLKERTAAEHLVALVRTPEKAADLGIETRVFDYSIPEGQADALKGVDTLLLISGSEERDQGGESRWCKMDRLYQLAAQ